MPDLLGVLETSLYVEEFGRACPFYEQVLGLNSIYRDQRLCAYDVGSRGVLLLFLRGRSFETVQFPGGTIPPHDGNGPVHIAFSIAANELAAWEQRLKALAATASPAVACPARSGECGRSRIRHRMNGAVTNSIPGSTKRYCFLKHLLCHRRSLVCLRHAAKW